MKNPMLSPVSKVALELRAETVSCAEENGLVQLGWAVPDSAAQYVLITLPASDRASADELSGHSHYIEIRDQLYGRNGGLQHLAVLNTHQLVLRLNFPVPEVDADLTLTSAEPIPAQALAALRRVEALLK